MIHKRRREAAGAFYTFHFQPGRTVKRTGRGFRSQKHYKTQFPGAARCHEKSWTPRIRGWTNGQCAFSGLTSIERERGREALVSRERKPRAINIRRSSSLPFAAKSIPRGSNILFKCQPISLSAKMFNYTSVLL